MAALLALLLAVLAGYAERALFDSDQFANRATATLQNERVRARVATGLTDRVMLANAGDLLTARPLIEQAAAGVVGGSAFRQLSRAAVLDVHRALFDRDLDTVTLTIADAGTVVAAAVEALQPSVATQIRDDQRIMLLRDSIDDSAADLVRIAERIRRIAVILPLVWIALAALAVLLAPDRRRAVSRLGAGAAWVGVVTG